MYDAIFLFCILDGVNSLDGLDQWFSKCGTRTTSGTWASSSGTQRNLRIKYKSGRVSTKANCFKWERLFHAEH